MHILALFYADDVIFMAKNPDKLQDLLDICCEESTKLGLCSMSENTGQLPLLPWLSRRPCSSPYKVTSWLGPMTIKAAPYYLLFSYEEKQ